MIFEFPKKFDFKLELIGKRFHAYRVPGKDKVLIGFYDNKMLVALNDGKDSFEPPRATKPIDEATENKKVASSIKVITDFVDAIV
ncbi:DUF3137 domain-containing protein [Candidatus Saccharibacteria bacterium]|nr:DUF3137 domain-containing protein [Candidatus Saccharibacteria bacterium]